MEIEELHSIITHEIDGCSQEQREFFARVRIVPSRWTLRPWGDKGKGFWAVAVYRDRVLWYNDVEEGFNVSRFDVYGEIPKNEYWCNQDPLCWALPRLLGNLAPQIGPPKSLD